MFKTNKIIIIISVSILSNCSIVNALEKPEIYVQLGHGHGAVFSEALSPDGKYLLTQSSKDLILWDIESGREIRTFKNPSEQSGFSIIKPRFSPNGRYALSSFGSAGTLTIWDIQTGEIFKTLNISFALSAKFSPDGKYISTSGGYASNEWEIETGKKTFNLGGYLSAIDYSPDGQYVAVLTQFTNIILVKKRQDRIEETDIVENQDVLLGIKFSPKGKYLLGKLLDKNDYKIFNVKRKREIARLQGLSDNIDKIVFSPDDKYLLYPGPENTLILWDIEKKETIRNYKGHTADIYSYRFSPDSDYLITSGRDKTLKTQLSHTFKLVYLSVL